jgi:NOL1/NOP2/fmu family ribosome biogenesis protein
VALPEDVATRFRHGSEVTVDGTAPAGRVAVFAGDTLLGVGRVVAGRLRPEKVLPEEGQ